MRRTGDWLLARRAEDRFLDPDGSVDRSRWFHAAVIVMREAGLRKEEVLAFLLLPPVAVGRRSARNSWVEARTVRSGGPL